VISGVVSALHEVTVRLPLRNAAGQEQEVEAVLDTGYTGSLTLPPSLIATLGLTWNSRGSAILANGAVEPFDIYAATVVWDGAPRRILISAIDTAPLLGMALPVGHDLRVRVVAGGPVEIEAVP
jgi:predicted aspartyl protease